MEGLLPFFVRNVLVNVLEHVFELPVHHLLVRVIRLARHSPAQLPFEPGNFCHHQCIDNIREVANFLMKRNLCKLEQMAKSFPPGKLVATARRPTKTSGLALLYYPHDEHWQAATATDDMLQSGTEWMFPPERPFNVDHFLLRLPSIRDSRCDQSWSQRQ